MNLKSVTLIAALGAFAFLLIPVTSIISSWGLKKHGVAVEGTVVKVSFHKRGLPQVTAAFNTKEGNRVEATASKRDQVTRGERVRLWYDPSFPQKIDFGDTTGYNLRGAILIGLMMILFSFYFVRYSVRDLANRKLVRSGIKIEAGDFSVVRNEKYRMGDNSPWIISCRWTDTLTKKEFHFVSKDYTIDPRPYLNGLDHIIIYIDPSDPGKYFMDTSFMPKGNITIG